MSDPNQSAPLLNTPVGVIAAALVAILGALGAQKLVPSFFTWLSSSRSAHQVDIDALRAKLEAQTSGIILELRVQITALEEEIRSKDASQNRKQLEQIEAQAKEIAGLKSRLGDS